MDLVYIGLTVVFFVLTCALANGCEKLGERQ